MDSQQAIEQVAKLKRFFPTLNDEQAAYLSDQFERFDVEPVSAAIDQHYRVYSQFVVGSKLVDDIERRSAQKRCLENQSAANREMSERRANHDAEKRECAARWQRIFDRVASIPETELERLREAIAEKQGDSPSWLKSKLLRADPKTSPILASLIFNEIGATV